ncbi:CDP-alcohol phosphatidyltransferase family protein [Euzebya tangerina]|uniref:CDP-alcohol phosphatidyltransferase family protein n=1 Tax=Euzebya tangerina TaxID=591198 RepID=UPI0013C330A2|nr:CDP-alcohol phosphatidyltransferase family protein [Euzebya tangerina]
MVRLFDAGLQEDQPVVVHDKVWTVANGITFVRLLGLPLFVWLMLGPQAYGMAFLTLAVVGATDWVDGYVARRFDQVTRLGKLIDPLIDRALLATAGLTLAAVGFLSWWIIAAILFRDVLLLGGALVVFGTNPEIPVTRLGKFATASLLIGVPAFLLAGMDWGGAAAFGVVGWAATAVGLVSYYAAGAQYAKIAHGMTGPDQRQPDQHQPDQHQPDQQETP